MIIHLWKTLSFFELHRCKW